MDDYCRTGVVQCVGHEGDDESGERNLRTSDDHRAVGARAQNRKTAAGRVRPYASDDILGDRGQVHFGGFGRCPRIGRDKKVLENLREGLRILHHLFYSGSQRAVAGRQATPQQLDASAQQREGGAEFVGSVGHEPSLQR